MCPKIILDRFPRVAGKTSTLKLIFKQEFTQYYPIHSLLRALRIMIICGSISKLGFHFKSSIFLLNLSFLPSTGRLRMHHCVHFQSKLCTHLPIFFILLEWPTSDFRLRLCYLFYKLLFSGAVEQETGSCLSKATSIK